MRLRVLISRRGAGKFWPLLDQLRVVPASLLHYDSRKVVFDGWTGTTEAESLAVVIQAVSTRMPRTSSG